PRRPDWQFARSNAVSVFVLFGAVQHLAGGPRLCGARQRALRERRIDGETVPRRAKPVDRLESIDVPDGDNQADPTPDADGHERSAEKAAGQRLEECVEEIATAETPSYRTQGASKPRFRLSPTAKSPRRREVEQAFAASIMF